MRSLLVTMVYASFFVYGLRAPVIFLLGYIWVDIFTPQYVAYDWLTTIPVSQLMGIALLCSMPFLRKSQDVRLRGVTALVGLFGIWITLTLFWAAVPGPAYDKWQWAVKSVLVSCLIPFFIRERADVEGVIWTIVIAGMANCLPFGAKVLISGGGYGAALGLVQGNHGYGEGSTLAMFAASLIPMCIFLMRHNTLVPGGRAVKVMLGGFIAAAILCSLGTFARTGLVCMGVLGVMLAFSSRHKIVYAVVALALVFFLPEFLGDKWENRMGTIGDTDEDSAMGRVAVWLWTLDYVRSHPLGGSFDLYRINVVELARAEGPPAIVFGKAFHSIYFEVLGEAGIPGALIYGGIFAFTLLGYRRARAIARRHDAPWLADLCSALTMSTIVFLAGGTFIGIAFQSYGYLLAALSAAVLNLGATEARLRPARSGSPRPAPAASAGASLAH